VTKADILKMGATAAVTALFTAIAAYVAMRVENAKQEIQVSQLKDNVQELKLERDRMRTIESQIAGLSDLKSERDKLRLLESAVAEQRGEFRGVKEELSRLFREVSTATRGGYQKDSLAEIYEQAARRLQTQKQ
jgi:hypothetical protein